MGSMLSIGTLNQKIFWLEPRYLHCVCVFFLGILDLKDWNSMLTCIVVCFLGKGRDQNRRLWLVCAYLQQKKDYVRNSGLPAT
jgi:hypothetical protein